MTCMTEATLKQFMLDDLEGVGPAADWTINKLTEPYNDTLLAYGVTDVGQATDIIKLRTLARVFVWRKLSKATTGNYDFKADDGDYKRSKAHEFIAEQLLKVERDALPYLPEWAGGIPGSGSNTDSGASLGYQVVRNIAVW